MLQRDGWRCQNCGSLRYLEVHHFQPRVRRGEDREENPDVLRLFGGK